MEQQGEQHLWRIYNNICEPFNLLPHFLGLPDSTAEKGDWELLEDVSMLLLGDSVERALTWDVNETAWNSHSRGLQPLLNEHWRVALKLPHLEMVYQFAPGSHMIGPYHDDVPWDMTVVNALPRAFELHHLLTGRALPNVVVFSNTLWDLGRWLFLGGVAEPEREEHFGKPLLRHQEYLPQALLLEWKKDTELQMRRIEERVEKGTLLIYHNAAFAKMVDCRNSTQHVQNGMGRRTHLVQLNALTRQIVAENPRWHLVDLGHMSESFLANEHLRDEHHPKREMLLQVLNLYLNLHLEHGAALKPAELAAARSAEDVADAVRRWDEQYLENAGSVQSGYLYDAERTQDRLARERRTRQHELLQEQRRRTPGPSKSQKFFMKLSWG